MKILHIHPTLRSGGIEAIICGLVNEMVQLHDVTVCTIFKPQSTDVFYNKLHPKVKKFSLGKLDFGFSISEVFKIFNVIKKGNYDVVHIHGCFYYYMLAVLLLHSKVKFVYTVHSDADKENISWDRKFFFFKKYCFVHHWVYPVTISPISQQSFYSLYGCDSAMIYNGVQKPYIEQQSNLMDNLRITPKTKLFIHPGRITEAKNQLVLCKVFKRLIDEGHDVVLVIAGMKEDAAIFQSIEPFLSNRIQYIGERSDVPQLMSRADAFCLPSIWEGLPVTLLEALSVGCIPICSPVGGIVNVVKNLQNGLLSKSSSEEDYYQTMVSFLQIKKSQLQDIKVKCKASFETYDVCHTASLYIKEYSK